MIVGTILSIAVGWVKQRLDQTPAHPNPSVAHTADFGADGRWDCSGATTTGHVGISEMHKNFQTRPDLGGTRADQKFVGIGQFNSERRRTFFRAMMRHIGI